MCFFHVLYNVRKRTRQLTDAAVTMVYKGIIAIQYSASLLEFYEIRNTIVNQTETFERDQSKTDKKFTAAHQARLCDFYDKHPLSYLDEAQTAFVQAHHFTISTSSIWRIIHEFGLTWKVLERRAMHIKERDVNRFINELSRIDWSHYNLIFLDERMPRVSVLAFIGVSGLIDYFDTHGTFDRVKIFKCCRDFAYSKRGRVRQYSGSHSVWILDGAHYNQSSGRDLLLFAVQNFR
ncbi:hypothetical protein PHMEG_00021682 [Phytophthora megakarya]|uniref:Transposase n=1 Tax=Phytophthora megakarya TaxID=4795 RepID=A0A225VM65_9STRA|nr:hypothetical protein PHMEG_00021682 [Phytophthora megakarya]